MSRFELNLVHRYIIWLLCTGYTVPALSTGRIIFSRAFHRLHLIFPPFSLAASNFPALSTGRIIFSRPFHWPHYIFLPFSRAVPYFPALPTTCVTFSLVCHQDAPTRFDWYIEQIIKNYWVRIFVISRIIITG